MKTLFTIACALFTVSSFAQKSIRENEQIILDLREKEKSSIGKSFPAFNGTCDGKTINNQSLKGKTVLINFWFEACPPCAAEFDALNELYKNFKDKPGFEFISFTFETPEKIDEIKAKYKIEYKIVSISRDECYRLNQNNGFPTNLILDKNHTITWLTCGGPADPDEAKDFIKSELYPRLSEVL